jgi:hypothetical protein
MTNALDNYKWGLAAPEGTPASWGARAIDDPSTFGLLGDRQSVTGGEPHRAALVSMLNGGVLPKARAEWGRLKAAYEVSGSEPKLVTLYEDFLVKVEANTNGSHGYVYLVAYIKPEAYTATRLRGYPNGNPDDTPEGSLVWSNDELPEVGETILATNAGWASSNGRMTVMGYAAENGHLFVVGSLENPTEQYTAQCDRQAAQGAENGKPPTGSLWNVMGREFKRFRVEANGFGEAAEVAEIEKVRAIEDRDDRRAAMKALRTSRKARFAHVTEVYVALFPNDGSDAVLADRQYTPVGTMPVEEAKALVMRSVVGNTWEDYTIEGTKGTAVWLAYPGSSDERTWDGGNDAADIVGSL